MSSAEKTPDQIITSPADIDHSRYRVLLGPIRHIARPFHEIGEVRVVGTDSLSTAHSWLHTELARYLEPDHRERADGARAAIVDVDRAAATATLVSSLHGPTAAILDKVTALMAAAPPALLPDFSRPYRARLYNRLDLITYESAPFHTEAAARLWLQHKGEQAHSDGVQASITRLDPTLGWPRPVFEFAALRPDFGAKLHSNLTNLDNADNAFLPRVQPGAPSSMLGADSNTEPVLQEQTSASDLFGETVYRDRLAYHRHSTPALDQPTAADSHPAAFALQDHYRVRRDNPVHATWDTAMITAARHEADRALTPRRVFRFHDRRDTSRIIEVLWTGSAVPLHRRGWFATEHRQTPEATTFVAILGQRSSGLEILTMLTDRMAAFSTTTPVLRPAVDIPREPNQAILALDALHNRLTSQVHELTRQSDILRRPFAVHSSGPASTAESGSQTDRDYPPDRVFDFWRDGLFPGSRTGAITHNPLVRHNDRAEQALEPAAGRAAEQPAEHSTGTDPATRTERGGRITGLIEITHAQQPPEHHSTPTLETNPQAMPDALDRKQGPAASHELD
ncbi:hypothetical protein [Nocardia miyunensis]|uniref:hypothetical protein n=1 Tax=Nocardia miyunensis TaxID=282684 RepID=UPI00082D105F|nr:hypothetical protein [Nocardia miyunensis]